MTRHQSPGPWILTLLAAGALAAQHDPHGEPHGERRESEGRREERHEGRREERQERHEERHEVRREERHEERREAPRGGRPLELQEPRRRPEAPSREVQPREMQRRSEGRGEGTERREREGAGRPAALDRRSEPAQRSEREARSWQTQGAWHRGAWSAHATWKEHRAVAWRTDHRTWGQRGGYGGYVIPQTTYVGTFGDRHSFRIGGCPTIYQGYPRFGYGGYWFFIVDPWPEFWVDDWYAADDVYIAYDVDGYYLFNLSHPGVRLAIMVSL